MAYVPSRQSLVVLLAVTAGALAGAALSGTPAGACECVTPSWRLSRATDADTGEADYAAWPVSARIDSYPGAAWIESSDQSGETIDYLRAGDR